MVDEQQKQRFKSFVSCGCNSWINLSSSRDVFTTENISRVAFPMKRIGQSNLMPLFNDVVS